MVKNEPAPVIVCKATLLSLDRQCERLGIYMHDHKIKYRYIRRLQYINAKIFELLELLKEEEK